MNLKKHIIVAAAALFAIIPAQAGAPKDNPVLLSFAGSVSVNDGSAPKQQIRVSAEKQVLGPITAGIALATRPADNLCLRSTELTLGVNLPAFGKDRKNTPYLAISGGLTDVEGGLDDISFETTYGGQIGLRRWITGGTAVFAEANYRTDGDINDGTTQIFLGLTTALR